MQDAMEHENLNFLSRRMSERPRILRCYLGRNGDFAGEMFLSVGLGRKRKHVGRLVWSKETAVQGLHLGARGQQHVDHALQSRGAPGVSRETVERQLGQTRDAFLKDDQRPTILSS